MQLNMTSTRTGGKTTRTDADFAWRVLDQMPGPLLVVNESAQVVYANAALARLVGHDEDTFDAVSIFDYVHPDDAGWLAAAYLDIVDDADDAGDVQQAVFPSVHVRIVTTTGEVIPLEVTGSRSITDNQIGGVIYDIRPARYHDVLGLVLAGLTAGDSIGELLSHVAQLIALPPLDIEAAVLEQADDGGWSIVSSTSDALATTLSAYPDLPLTEPAIEPVRFDDAAIDPSTLAALRDLGFVDVWRVSVGSDDYEIVACSRRRQRRSTSVTERLVSARELANVVTLQAVSERRLRQAAEEDNLTGVFNRATFRRHVAAAVDCAPGQPAAVLFLDLDDFKPVNDRFGHAAGDAVLQVVTRRLRAAVRPDDLVARLGGDEFGVLLNTIDTPTVVSRIARRIVEAISEPIALSAEHRIGPLDQQVSISVSVGAAHIQAGESVDQLLGRADHLMYDAKRAGGRQVRIDAEHRRRVT